MTHRILPLYGCFFASSLMLLHAGAAKAEEPPKAEAAAPAGPKTDTQIKAALFFSEARKLVEAGDYKQACSKFEQSLSLNVGIGVQFNLADCWEHIGRTASARSLFLGAAASARAIGQTARAEVAQARADALEPRLVRMQIDVPANDAGLSVRRNRIAVEPQAWGVASPIDAGEYLIEASAPGKQPWSARVIVPSMTTEVVSVTVPPLAIAPPSAEAAKPEPAPEKLAKPALEQAPLLDADQIKDRRRTAYALTIGGVGVAALGLGTIMALEFESKNSDAKRICPSGTGCSQPDIDRHGQLVSDAKNYRTWSFVGIGVGSAAVIAATVLYLAPSSSSRASGLSAAPFVTADGSWGAFASGHF